VCLLLQYLVKQPIYSTPGGERERGRGEIGGLGGEGERGRGGGGEGERGRGEIGGLCRWDMFVSVSMCLSVSVCMPV
jgi:hypothetical protein